MCVLSVYIIYINIFKTYACMCEYLYIHNKYTQYTHYVIVNWNFLLRMQLI